MPLTAAAAKLGGMNAELRQNSNEIDAFRLDIRATALRRLGLRLGRARALGEAWDVMLERGAPTDTWLPLVDYWVDDFDFRAQEARLNELGLLQARVLGRRIVFAELRSPARFAMPLLLLSDAPAERESLLGPLTCPGDYAAGTEPAFHVVHPISWGAPGLDLATEAERYRTLMEALGYTRYLVHGSGRSALVAQELAKRDAEHVAALHVTRLAAFPTEQPCDLQSLSSSEKSQLALLTALYFDERPWAQQSPFERLAVALEQLADGPDPVRYRDALLTQLTLDALAESAGPELEFHPRAPTGPCRVPVALSSFPLDAPSLRRFVERDHVVLAWTQHEQGGAFPTLEAPALLLGELRQLFARFA